MTTLLAVGSPARAVTPDPVWVSQFGSPSLDFAADVDTDRSGEVAVLGCQRCFSGAARRLVVRRYDATGNLLWKRSVAADGDHNGHRLAVDKRSGDTYVVGYVYRAGPPPYGPVAFVTKIDRAGNRAWERQFATSTASGVAVGRGGTVFVPGEAGGDAAVTTFSPAGAQGATIRFGTSGADGASDAAFDASGYLYVVGTTTGTFPGQTASGGRDSFVAKFGAFGAQIWARQFGPGVDTVDNQPTLAVDGFGRAYVAGVTRSTADNPDAYVRAYDAAGAWLWQRELASAASDAFYDIEADGRGNVYVGGSTYGPLADPGATPGSPHALVVTYDPSGRLVAITQFEPPDGTAAVLGIALGPRSPDPPPVYVAGGATGAFAGQANAGDADSFVLRLRRPQPASR